MNKIILFARQGIELDANDINEILSSLSEGNFMWKINFSFANMITRNTGIVIPEERQYDVITREMAEGSVVVSYGGDGTFLEAVWLAYGFDVPILGINYGRLGFLANTTRESAGIVFEELRNGHYEIQPRTMLEISGDFGAEPQHPFALNEFSIFRKEINMADIDVFVDDDKIATYRGDGVLISTPTGSTAYSLSVGGPIIAPACECFVISPIAPHNLTMRPLVIPDTSEIRFKINGRAAVSSVSIDNRSFDVPFGSEFKVRKANKPVFLVNPQNISFYDTLRNKMMWGIDSLDQHK